MMKRYIWTAFGLSLIPLFFYLFFFQNPPLAKVLERPLYVQPLLDQFEEEIHHEFVQSATPGAAVVVVKDSEIWFMKGLGRKKIGRPDSVDSETVFRIGSLSKGIAATLAAIMVGEGQLNWDDRVMEYYPQFKLQDPNERNRTRISHLLSHTTGLPYHTYTDLIEYGRDIHAINDLLPQVALIAKPGELYSYQNAAYSIIEPILGKVAGCSFGQLMEEKLFEPLGMHHSSTSYEGIMSKANKAWPHLLKDSAWKVISHSKRYYNAVSAGGVNASISDMARYLQLILAQRQDILSEESLDSLLIPRINTRNRARYFQRWPFVKDAWYAMGWRVLVGEQDTLYHHGGYVNGFRSEIALSRKHGYGICILANANTNFPATCIPTFVRLFDQYAIHDGNEALEPESDGPKTGH